MSELSINNKNFLWMTRGKSWEFRFLSKCSSLSSVIDAVYKSVFLRDESRFGYWKGIITVDGAKQSYVACRCYDSIMQRDEAGRRIPHDFLLLCSNEEYNQINQLAWESLILEQVRGLYSKRYSLCANEVADCAIDFSIHLDSSVKPCDSCETYDVSLDPTVPQTNPETHSTSRSFPRTYLFPILLICLAVGSIAVKTFLVPDVRFLPILGSNVCVGETPVTNAEYSKFVKATDHVAPRCWENGEFPNGRRRNPVLWVSYEDASAYCDWLSSKDAEHVYRLPTEKEWELAVGCTLTNASSKTKGVCGGKEFRDNALEWTSTTCGVGTNAVKGGFLSSSHTHARPIAEGYADVAFRIVREDAAVATMKDILGD